MSNLYMPDGCMEASDREHDEPEPCDCCEECPECLCHLMDYERVALKEELGEDCPF